MVRHHAGWTARGQLHGTTTAQFPNNLATDFGSHLIHVLLRSGGHGQEASTHEESHRNEWPIPPFERNTHQQTNGW